MSAYEQISSNKWRSWMLIAVFVALVVAIGWAWDVVQGGSTFVLPVAVAFAAGTALIGYFKGDRIALAANRAQRVEKSEARELHRIVENLAITAGLEKPAVYVIPSPAMNAFATGRDPKHASIAITEGLWQRLDRTELEGVLAHELSHIKNFDTRLMMIVTIFVGLVVLLADWFLRARLFGFGGRDSREAGQVGAVLTIIGFALILLSPLFAKLIQFAVSRRREFLADASAVLLTRYPEGLASALRKISQSDQPVETANSATAHLYFANPLSRKTLHRFFSTHPPVEERIRALQDM